MVAIDVEEEVREQLNKIGGLFIFQTGKHHNYNDTIKKLISMSQLLK